MSCSSEATTTDHVGRIRRKADSFVPDKPRLWFDKQLADEGGSFVANYDLAPDGASPR
jgi:hypothetical protein